MNKGKKSNSIQIPRGYTLKTTKYLGNSNKIAMRRKIATRNSRLESILVLFSLF